MSDPSSESVAMGAAAFETAGHGAAGPLDLLRRIAREVLIRHPRMRSERHCGIHNPWGAAAGLADCWSFLAVCEAPATVDAAARVAGDDLILWDSELYPRGAAYVQFVREGREGRYWPADPLQGAAVLVPLAGADERIIGLPVPGPSAADLELLDEEAPLYVIRYMAGTSLFRRDPAFAANRIGMEERVLVNYATRPLWLVRGESRPDNDFVTGFAPAPPRWAGPSQPGS